LSKSSIQMHFSTWMAALRTTTSLLHQPKEQVVFALSTYIGKLLHPPDFSLQPRYPLKPRRVKSSWTGGFASPPLSGFAF